MQTPTQNARQGQDVVIGRLPAAMSTLRRQGVLAMLIGELVGFLPPALTGAALAGAGAPDALGRRSHCRRHAAPVDGRAWLAVTSAAAGFAWLVGMGGGALLGSAVLPPAVLLVLLVPAWTAALLGMGASQWLVLRRTVPRSGRWVPATPGAWLFGVALPVAALSAVPGGWPSAIHVVVGILAAVAMGATIGVLTAPTLRRLLRQCPHRSASAPPCPTRSTPAGRRRERQRA